ncbi:hypothetical protein BDQ12DRAFT_714647 [Crucibulum laeve]|uniref:FAD/NAD(P)-binding domain-containing protein n=1 Tax=Crucibulum laeve TaxID=68775 RepID=A0A5C3LU46_9AGAR|nr:hypothetical protein BDQ12DRAFT_714647 [Crucibulum laeve]
MAPTPHPSEGPLPTLSKLGLSEAPKDIDALKIAADWLSSFEAQASSANVDGVLDLLLPGTYSSSSNENDPSAISFYWRDLLALTWDFRTFEGSSAVKQFLTDRLAQVKISNVRLQIGDGKEIVGFQQPFPDVAWIQAMFKFETAVGFASGIVRLVPFTLTNNPNTIKWKAHSLLTNLEDLRGFPEKKGPYRNQEPNHGKWAEQRQQEAGFANEEPVALIVGGGQSGLEVAARLKALGVSSLIIEKNPKIGDNWRNRYDALCLHDPVWYDHLPYIPFPDTWPVFTPARKLANWLESYADAMELNVWTSSTVTKASQDPENCLWYVTVKKSDGTERLFKVKHFILALGFKGGQGYIPEYSGMDVFKGQILHSLHHGKALDHAGKKVVVIGSCTSAHDISVDYANHGVDVTMFQRSSTYVMSTKHGLKILMGALYSEDGPPTDIADRINASFPNLLNLGVSYRVTQKIAEADKETLDGLRARGFRTNMGTKDAGFFLMVWGRAGGYYLDVGGSQYIIDGKVKLKNDSQIKNFTEKGIEFDNGSKLDADVVIFSTGLSDPREGVGELCGDAIADGCNEIWGMNSEGEINGVWRDMGFKGLWYVMGNLAMCRFHSKHIALQIKAMEEGVFGERYSAKS